MRKVFFVENITQNDWGTEFQCCSCYAESIMLKNETAVLRHKFQYSSHIAKSFINILIRLAPKPSLVSICNYPMLLPTVELYVEQCVSRDPILIPW